jgi:hypothetical protein
MLRDRLLALPSALAPFVVPGGGDDVSRNKVLQHPDFM